MSQTYANDAEVEINEKCINQLLKSAKLQSWTLWNQHGEAMLG